MTLPPLPGGCIGVLATLLGHGKADWVKNVPGWAAPGACALRRYRVRIR